MSLLAILVAVAAAILSMPALIFFVECLASLFLTSRRQVARPEGVSVAVLIPAHDEKEGIGPTVTGVQSQLAPGDRVLVVADNCTDNTSDLAVGSGAAR